MAISAERKKEIKRCVENAVEILRKETERSFNKENHHKSGRSGGHGKKFNIISTAIIRNKNNLNYLNKTECFENDEEKKEVVAEFEKYSKMFHNRAKSISHK